MKKELKKKNITVSKKHMFYYLIIGELEILPPAKKNEISVSSCFTADTTTHIHTST